MTIVSVIPDNSRSNSSYGLAHSRRVGAMRLYGSRSIKRSRGIKSERNREIMVAFEAGQSIEELAATFTLTENRVRALLSDEKHRRVVSIDPYYCAFRRKDRNITFERATFH